MCCPASAGGRGPGQATPPPWGRRELLGEVAWGFRLALQSAPCLACWSRSSSLLCLHFCGWDQWRGGEKPGEGPRSFWLGGGGWFEECAPEQVRMQAGTAVAELQPGERPAIAPPGPVAQLTCSVRDLSCQKGSPLLSRGSCPHRNGGCFSPGRKPLVPPHTHTARRLPLVAEEAGPGNYSAPPAWKRNS